MFATDLDENAIAQARDGTYPETISADVSEDRLRRFFNKGHGKHRVKREMIPANDANTALVFAGNAQLNSVENISGGFLLNSLTFDSTADAFVLGGPQGSETLDFRSTTGNVLPTLTQNSSAAETINLNLQLSAALTLGGTGTGTLALNGVITGGGSLTLAGVNTVSLTGKNTYTGGTNLNAGTLSLGNTQALGTSGMLSFGGGYPAVHGGQHDRLLGALSHGGQPGVPHRHGRPERDLCQRAFGRRGRSRTRRGARVPDARRRSRRAPANPARTRRADPALSIGGSNATASPRGSTRATAMAPAGRRRGCGVAVAAGRPRRSGVLSGGAQAGVRSPARGCAGRGEKRGRAAAR